VLASAAAPGGAQAVLIIDDDDAVGRTIERILASAGVKVLLAHSAEAARQLVPQAAALVLDVHLKGMGGIEFLRELRAEGAQLPVLMISGDRSRSTVQACLEAGICDYLLKPFDRTAFLEKLRKHVPSVFPWPVGPSTAAIEEMTVSDTA
jgi:DNA-binding response OmpR family regulator